MPKQKTHSGAKKRFKVTGSGKIMREQAGKRHLLEKKPSHLKRKLSGEVELEKKIKDDLSVTVRCIPLEKSEPGTCPFTGKPSAQRVVWAKAY